MEAVRVEVGLEPRLNYALQQNGAPLVRFLRLHNLGDRPLVDVEVLLSVNPAVARPTRSSIARIDGHTTYNLGPVDVPLDGAALAQLTEREVGALRVQVTAGGVAVGDHHEPLEVLAYNEWGGIGASPELLAAFVLPNHPSLPPILTDAARRIEARTGSGALDGYQSRDPQRVAHLAAAVYEAVAAAGVRYVNPPASFSAAGQKVRTPEQVLDTKLGTCLDLTVVLAAALEAIGLHPVLVLTADHAFPGVWLTEVTLQDPVQDDPVLLRKRVDLREALVFDSSTVTQGVPFDRAVRVARQRLDDSDAYRLLIDVAGARKLRRVLPLPARAAGPAAFAGLGAPNPVERSYVPQIRPFDPAPAIARDTEPKLEQWKRKLLDLSLRNRLLNLRPTKGTVQLEVADLHRLEDRLARESSFALVGQLPAEAREGLFDAGRVSAPHTQAELDKRLLELYRASRTALEDSGAHTLYLGLGALYWTETPSSRELRRAPVVLLPVQLTRGAVGEPFRLAAVDAEVRVNVTLLEKMRRDAGVDTSGLDQLHEDDHGLDLDRIFTAFRRAVVNLGQWEVREEAWLAQFTFTKFLMWLDLQARAGDLLKNRVVARLVRGTSEPHESIRFLAPADLDRAGPARDDLAVVDADSSQRAAIAAAIDGRDFVLQGPPGTGKSQTITNLIAQTLARGRTVLFVSEKRAALEVVHHRLTQAGLGPFCLDLHANDAARRALATQLQAPLALAGLRPTGEWERHADKLEAARTELNALTERLHAPGPFGESAHQVAGRLVALADAPRVPFDRSIPDRDGLDALEEAADEVQRRAAEVGRDDPWRGVGREVWDPQEVRSGVDGASYHAQALIESWSPAFELLGAGAGAPTRDHLRVLARIATLLLESPRPPEGLISDPGWSDLEGQLSAAIRDGVTRRAALEALEPRWTDALHALPLDALADTFRRWVGSWFGFLFLWPARRALATAARGRVPPSADVLADLERARLARDHTPRLDESVGRRLGAAWRGSDTDWDRAAAVVSWVGQLREQLLWVPDPVRTRVVRLAVDGLDREARGVLEPFARTHAAYAEALDEVSRALLLDPDPCFGPEGDLRAVVARVDRWRADLPGLRRWSAWLRARARAVDAGLGSVVAGFERGKVAVDQIRRAADRSVRERWLERLGAEHPELARFRGADHQERIERFRALDRSALKLARAEVVARVASRLPDPEAPGEMAVVRAELKKRGRHTPARQLFSRIPTALGRLKPCVLMSPLSVAQYLDPALAAFDLVVFDEASQIPPWDAVGAIARGQQVVVVGDSKQLPPTSFFDSTGEDEDELDSLAEPDLESILDQCVVAGLPNHTLRWHYRSRHESLITFSNHHYYDGSLLTFPSAAAEVAELGVKWRHVPGFYDRGGARTNEAEARAVVAEIVERLRRPGATGSIGVVTFSIPQQRLIEDLLDVERKDPGIDRFFGAAVPEPLFVKNLENVQGDERDVMLFSIGYGPDRAGRVTMNFGPLNRPQGERRLNVAITRARELLVVFSTLEPDRIGASASVGVRHLRTFLDYAARGVRAIDEAVVRDPQAEADSPFELEVERALQRFGYEVHRQVGCSGYRIDLAIPDRDRPGRYRVGIECDGATYHSARCARDRDRLRQQVLEDLGWRLLRVWSTDWWHDPAGEIERLMRAIEADPPPRARATEVVSAPPPAVPPPAPVRDDRVEYAQMVVHPDRARDEFERREADADIATLLYHLVQAEGPIHRDELARRVAWRWSVGRVTERLRARVLDAANLIATTHRPVVRGSFYWPADLDPATWQKYRVPPAGKAARPAEQICPEEAANAAQSVLRRALAIDRDELCREAARALGYARMGAGVLEGMDRGVDHLADTGHAAIDGARVRWVSG